MVPSTTATSGGHPNGMDDAAQQSPGAQCFTIAPEVHLAPQWTLYTRGLVHGVPLEFGHSRAHWGVKSSLAIEISIRCAPTSGGHPNGMDDAAQQPPGAQCFPCGPPQAWTRVQSTPPPGMPACVLTEYFSPAGSHSPLFTGRLTGHSNKCALNTRGK